jgi:hypothetical protein
MKDKIIVNELINEIEEQIKEFKKLIKEESKNRLYLIGRLQSYQWIHLLLISGKVGADKNYALHN